MEPVTALSGTYPDLRATREAMDSEISGLTQSCAEAEHIPTESAYSRGEKRRRDEDVACTVPQTPLFTPSESTDFDNALQCDQLNKLQKPTASGEHLSRTESLNTSNPDSECDLAESALLFAKEGCILMHDPYMALSTPIDSVDSSAGDLTHAEHMLRQDLVSQSRPAESANVKPPRSVHQNNNCSTAAQSELRRRLERLGTSEALLNPKEIPHLADWISSTITERLLTWSIIAATMGAYFQTTQEAHRKAIFAVFDVLCYRGWSDNMHFVKALHHFLHPVQDCISRKDVLEREWFIHILQNGSFEKAIGEKKCWRIQQEWRFGQMPCEDISPSGRDESSDVDVCDSDDYASDESEPGFAQQLSDSDVDEMSSSSSHISRASSNRLWLRRTAPVACAPSRAISGTRSAAFVSSTIQKQNGGRPGLESSGFPSNRDEEQDELCYVAGFGFVSKADRDELRNQ